MARLGMATLIRRLRQMTEAGTADYSLAGQTYWSDDDLQAELDEHRTRHIDVALAARPDYVSGEEIYTRYEIPWSGGASAMEGTAGGSDAFKVADSTGATIAAANYSFSERDLAVTFTADQEGSARYWSGYSYDIRAAAREIWLRKAGHYHSAINFSADGHRFDREALYGHCMQMAQVFGHRRGMQSGRLARTDLAGQSKSEF
jgi:hypothetical protein